MVKVGALLDPVHNYTSCEEVYYYYYNDRALENLYVHGFVGYFHYLFSNV